MKSKEDIVLLTTPFKQAARNVTGPLYCTTDIPLFGICLLDLVVDLCISLLRSSTAVRTSTVQCIVDYLVLIHDSTSIPVTVGSFNGTYSSDEKENLRRPHDSRLTTTALCTTGKNESRTHTHTYIHVLSYSNFTLGLEMSHIFSIINLFLQCCTYQRAP